MSFQEALMDALKCTNSKNQGVISLNHALMARLTPDRYAAIRAQMREDLDAHYAKLGQRISIVRDIHVI